MTQSELSSLTGSGAWGNTQKFHSDLAFLLVLPEKATAEEMMLGLAMVWVHPYQASIPTLDEAVRKLTLLTTSHENWAYTFVRFNEDAQHVPLPKEGHLNAMIEGTPGRNTCGHLCQLEVCLLLQLWCQGGLPRRAEWGPRTSGNISTRISCPWDKYAQQTYIPICGPI